MSSDLIRDNLTNAVLSLPESLSVEVVPSSEANDKIYDLDRVIYELDSQLDLLSSKADTTDYLVAIGSGLLCGLMDILWVGNFDLYRGRDFASEEVDEFVKSTARLFGCKKEDLSDCVKFLEDKFPIPSDGNTSNFGGGNHHHMRDFAHHPTIVGLAFSLLTQFTEKSYGTDTNGVFIVVDVPERSRAFIGKDTGSKIINGTIIWFFHLVSDMAGSNSSAGLSGGTGIPGPILSLAKELSVLPGIRDICVNESSLSLFLQKLFNGTLLAKHDENNKIIKDTVLKMDLRGELGVIAELGREALPVIANDAIVRTFFFIRRLGREIKRLNISSVSDLGDISWKTVVPNDNPTIVRMLTVATGVFTTVDISEAVLTQKYWVAVNYVGVGRFAVALEEETTWALKRRDVNAVRNVYVKIRQNVFRHQDNRIYGRLQEDMNNEKLGLTLEETEILYNIEFYKTKYDIAVTKTPINAEPIKALKLQWLNEWASYMSNGFDEFVQIKDAELHWYSQDELRRRISQMNPTSTWFKLVLLEAMLFEPYFALSTETKNGKEVPSKKYSALNKPLGGYNEAAGDKYLEDVYAAMYCDGGFIRRLRKTHNKATKELNEVLKATIKGFAIGAGVIIVTIATAGAFAPQIAVALVGSNFAGLSGAALTNACLAYLGGGAIAMGGLGMAGGTITIVGGGAILGVTAGAGAGGVAAALSIGGKEEAIAQSAKLLVAVQEIFLNDEHDIDYSTSVYEQYVSNVMEIEKSIAELKVKADVASKEEKKELTKQIKNSEESVHAMKIAMKSMNKYIGSYKVGLGLTD